MHVHGRARTHRFTVRGGGGGARKRLLIVKKGGLQKVTNSKKRGFVKGY